MAYHPAAFYLRFIDRAGDHAAYAQSFTVGIALFAAAAEQPDVYHIELWKREGETPETVRRICIARYASDGIDRRPMAFEGMPRW